MLQALLLQQGLGVPQLLALALAAPELVAVLVDLHPELPGPRQLPAAEELKRPLAGVLRALLFMAFGAGLRLYVVVVRGAAPVGVEQALKVPALVLVDLPAVVPLVVVHHVVAAGGPCVGAVHYAAVARLLVLLVVPAVAVLLAGRVPGVFRPLRVAPDH